ncbi:hypothetical protein GCM10009827_101450 [Dactylosporangium maewongense]|uniref:Aminoglycoside phosphotransferase domain-containing protein n=1 Tax=Dactylosporangium maewongense TaxID=634393 RepID=A0ABN2CUL4_9ACTN
MSTMLKAPERLDLVDEALLGTMLGAYAGTVRQDTAKVLGGVHDGAHGSVTRRYWLTDGGTVVFKRSHACRSGDGAASSADEAAVLAAIGSTDLPAARVLAAARVGGWAGMLLHDLGPADAVRPVTVDDTATLAAWVHQTEVQVPPSDLPVIDSTSLADLVTRQIPELLARHAAMAGVAAEVIRDVLPAVRRVAEVRCGSADRQPRGLCHGQLHPARVHRTAAGRAVLGWSRAYHGPVLLDLAALHHASPASGDWATVLHDYVRSGGSDAVYDNCDGLDSGRWASGWHHLRRAAVTLTDLDTVGEPLSPAVAVQLLSRLRQAQRCLT